MSYITTLFGTGNATVCSLNVDSYIFAYPPERLYTLNDLNNDGYMDLIVYSNLGVNCKAQYWLGKGQGRFYYLGKFQELHKKDILFNSYERGGRGGLEYESKEYYFKGDCLITCRTLKQIYERNDADTFYFNLTEIANPPCGDINKTIKIKVYQNDDDSTVIDTIR